MLVVVSRLSRPVLELSWIPSLILFLKGLSSPLIAEDEGAGMKELKLRFDVSQYTPEEIMVKTVDNKLLVMKEDMMAVL